MSRNATGREHDRNYEVLREVIQEVAETQSDKAMEAVQLCRVTSQRSNQLYELTSLTSSSVSWSCLSPFFKT